MSVRLAIVGWDSATFDVIDPLMADSRLPTFASLADRGYQATLRSTWPPMTDCAWTSAFTGANPGRHGIFGSWYRAPGSYSCRYFSARDRRSPALWELTEGIRHLVWNVPMTYPPEPIEGAMVAGYGAPPGSRFCEPDDLLVELSKRWRVDDLLDRAPHGSLERFCSDLIRSLETQAEAIVWSADRIEADCVSLVWPQIDRAQHFFWQYRGTDHPLHDAVDRVYEAMDQATGRLVEAFDTADFLIVSDHGAGPLKGDVNLGGWLEQNRFATYSETNKRQMVDVAWKFPPAIRRAARRIAPGLARRAMGATLAGALAPFEWSRTQAFVGFHGDVWLNLKGREPDGVVDDAEADAVADELAGRLATIENPRTGERVFERVYLRDEIYRGPAVDLAPDLVVDSWSAGYRIAPNRGPTEELVNDPHTLAGVQVAWSSDHRPEGIWLAAGPSVATGRGAELSLYDVCPTALALLGEPLPEEIDGIVAENALQDSFLERHPVRRSSSRALREAQGGFTEAEAAAVAEHLKDLGYIE